MIKYILIFFAILGAIYFGLKRKAKKLEMHEISIHPGEVRYFMIDKKTDRFNEVDLKKDSFIEGDFIYTLKVAMKSRAGLVLTETK
jgi:hypothetical protein